ncbi:unnamed protein product [Phytomonas sp. Hart1]|nr:unnamed protein product [Phytomonas sp. Hart1]|eukprot:CCW72180.1 unnamed protein product [Phytomonas sp. isolate Hart1]
MPAFDGKKGDTSGLLSAKPPSPLLTKHTAPRPYHLRAITTGVSSHTPRITATRHHVSPRATGKKNSSPVARYEPCSKSLGNSSCRAVEGFLGATPLPSSSKPPNILEDLLQCLVHVDDQLLDDSIVCLVKTALARLKRCPHPHRGPKSPPCPITSSLPPLEEAVVECLCRACRAATEDAAEAVLSGFYLTHNTASSGPEEAGTCSMPICPVVAALGQLRLQRVLEGSRRNASDDIEDCLELLDAVVGLGHPGAMVGIALCLKNGLGVPSDLEAALMWLSKAAEIGYVPAMHELGILYEKGAVAGPAVLEEDWGEAMLWYRKAAVVGHIPSQLNLGKLLLSAAQQQAAMNIASALEIQDMTSKSREWLECAAGSGCKEARRLLERI